MHFRTEFSPSQAPFAISHSDKILLLGSCFSENFDEKLRFYGFDCHTNPFGIIFNPLSIFNHLKEISCKNLSFWETGHVLRDDIYLNFHAHSKFSMQSKDALSTALYNQSKMFFLHLSNSNVLFITLGTAFVYRHKKSKIAVANCHKISAENFKKQLLSVGEIFKEFKQGFAHLEKLNNKLQIVFTVSPVRHLKDGFHENQLSKATLLLAIQQICDTFQNCSYFPSYELLIDDLRDYRFYKDDLIHPSAQSINYIWEKFEQCYFSPSTQYINSEIQKLRLAMAHRSLQPESLASKKFEKKLKDQIQKFSDKYPNIKL